MSTVIVLARNLPLMTCTYVRVGEITDDNIPTISDGSMSASEEPIYLPMLSGEASGGVYDNYLISDLLTFSGSMSGHEGSTACSGVLPVFPEASSCFDATRKQTLVGFLPGLGGTGFYGSSHYGLIASHLPPFNGDLLAGGAFLGVLPSFGGSCGASEPVVGRISSYLRIAFAGALLTGANINGNLPAMTFVANGHTQVAGEVSGSFPLFNGTAEAFAEVWAGMSSWFPAMSGHMAGHQDEIGEMIGALPSFSGRFTAQAFASGFMLGNIPVLRGRCAGGRRIPHVLTLALPLIKGDLSGGPFTVHDGILHHIRNSVN